MTKSVKRRCLSGHFKLFQLFLFERFNDVITYEQITQSNLNHHVIELERCRCEFFLPETELETNTELGMCIFSSPDELLPSDGKVKFSGTVALSTATPKTKKKTRQTSYLTQWTYVLDEHLIMYLIEEIWRYTLRALD